MTLRAVSSIGTSGGGIGLKSAGVVAQSAVPASVTGTLSETTLATIPIPAGAMGVNGRLRITASYSYTNSANSKQLIVRFGGAVVRGSTRTTSAQDNFIDMLANRGVANSQFYALAFTTGASAAGIQATSAIDTTQAQNLTLNGTLANIGETITLESYTVEILNP